MVVIICSVYSILSMTIRHYWSNVWFHTLDAYLKMQLWDRGQSWRAWLDLEHKFDGILIHKRLWNLSCVRHNRLTFYALCRTISNVSVPSLHELVFKVMVVTKKAHFALLPVFLAVSSLTHHNVISSWINGRFTCLITSILNEFSAFSISGEVILRDPSQITISVTKMHLLSV